MPPDPSVAWINVTKEHFIVWMQIVGFSSFKKIWGVINHPLEPGNYYF